MRLISALPLSLAVAAIAVALPAPAFADPLPYGPDTCANGFVSKKVPMVIDASWLSLARM